MHNHLVSNQRQLYFFLCPPSALARTATATDEDGERACELQGRQALLQGGPFRSYFAQRFSSCKGVKLSQMLLHPLRWSRVFLSNLLKQ